MNCFNFTFKYLKEQGLNIPNEWNGMQYDTEFKKIEDNPKKYLRKKLHIDFFSSFTKKVENAQKRDIILHNNGVGVAINNIQFMTINHLSKIKIFTIKKEYDIRRVI